MGTEGGTVGAMQRNTYEGAPYHHFQSKGLKSRAPIDGQGTLDNSLQVKNTSPRRVGWDPANKEAVVFDQTRPGVFHGHVEDLRELPEQARRLLKEWFGL